MNKGLKELAEQKAYKQYTIEMVARLLHNDTIVMHGDYKQVLSSYHNKPSLLGPRFHSFITWVEGSHYAYNLIFPFHTI